MTSLNRKDAKQRTSKTMKIRLFTLLASSILWLGSHRAQALDFYLALASYTQGNTTSYVADRKSVV